MHVINFIGVTFVSYFCILEFFSEFYFAIDIQDFVPRTMKAIAIYQLGLPRVYGFSEEPTYVAWYLLTLGMIAIYWIVETLKNNLTKFIFILPIIISFLLTFSGAGIGIFLAVGPPIFFLYSKNKIRWIRYFSIFLFLFVYLSQQLEYSFFEPFLKKIFFSQGETGNSNINDLHRGEIWKQEINSFYDNPIAGKGLGYYSYHKGGTVVNFYLLLILEAGILPLLCLIMFYWGLFKKILSVEVSAKPYLLISFLCGIGHLFSQSLFHHPCIWFTFIFIYKHRSLTI